MAKSKSPRSPKPTSNQVIPMPDANPAPQLQVKKSPTAVTTMPPSTYSTDVQTRIRLRAYELYEQRGYTAGFDQEDWFQAEREILGQSDTRKQSA